MTPFRLKVIRGMFGVGERVAPSLTGRAAFALFCRTPSVKRLTLGERRAVLSASDFMTEARHHRLKTRAGCIVAHEFRPQPGRARGGTILVLHGWRSRTEYMRALIEGYREAGYKVVSLDLPGHGQSAGRRLTVVNAVEAVCLVADWFGPFEAVVGHSFGGAVAVNAAVGSIPGLAPLATKRLVLVAAPSSLPKVFDGFSQMLNVGPRSQTVMAGRVERISGRPLSDFLGDRQLAGSSLPTLVIHAPDDREVSAEQARLYAAAGEHVELYWAKGLGHRRILSDPAVVERAVAFVQPAAKAVLH
ncbi:hydrolase [Mesorhizobium sp. Root157]|uniref:alpha/beta hydrolase n=1 Tax=Mesorhizobium sp. Root157 TaxID=1736477 RepID=UPI000701572A|nr:alpha/beta fold hydrolase [Mesorhizobium sp. Root157]KQZ98474.1 hydrolase [Mesorhizobium sp. Root157]